MMIIVCGDRLWDQGDAVRTVLDKAKAELGSDLIVVTGGARGADSMAYQWTIRNLDHENTIKIPAEWEVHHPDWCKCNKPEARFYCPMAGHRRNQQMLDTLLEGRTVNNHLLRVLAFKDDFDRTLKRGGTEDMVQRALAAGVVVFLYDKGRWEVFRKSA